MCALLKLFLTLVHNVHFDLLRIGRFECDWITKERNENKQITTTTTKSKKMWRWWEQNFIFRWNFCSVLRLNSSSVWMSNAYKMKCYRQKTNIHSTIQLNHFECCQNVCIALHCTALNHTVLYPFKAVYSFSIFFYHFFCCFFVLCHSLVFICHCFRRSSAFDLDLSQADYSSVASLILMYVPGWYYYHGNHVYFELNCYLIWKCVYQS